jgi:hypothetical protein
MSTVHCARCSREAAPRKDAAAPGRWFFVDPPSSDARLFACGAPCAASINDQRVASGFSPWTWTYQEGPEPRDSTGLELALWLTHLGEELALALQALHKKDPGAAQRCAQAKKEFEGAIRTCAVILLKRVPSLC